MDIKELLKNHTPFLFGLTDQEIDLFANSAEIVVFPPGHTIFMQGETVDELHLISTGKVAVLVHQQPHHPAVQIAQLGPGMVFGETSIIESGVAGATIQALEETAIYTISQETFLQVLAENKALRDRVTAYINFRKARLNPTGGTNS